MSASYIMYYPRGSSSFETIILPRTSDLLLSDRRARTDAFPVGGSLLTADLGGWRDVRIISERITDTSVINQLLSLDSHIRSGGSIAYALSLSKSAGAWARAGVRSGSTTISLRSLQEFPYDTTELKGGSEITIESPNPNHFRQWAIIDSVNGNVITLTSPLLYDMDGPVFVRYKDFYPVLFMEASQADSDQWLTHDHRRNYTVDLQLVEMPGSIQLLAPVIDLVWSDAAPEGIGHLTTDAALGVSRVTGPRISGTELGAQEAVFKDHSKLLGLIGLG